MFNSVNFTLWIIISNYYCITAKLFLSFVKSMEQKQKIIE